MYVLSRTRLVSRILNLQQYAQPVTKKGKAQTTESTTEEPKKLSNHVQRNLEERKKGVFVDTDFASDFQFVGLSDAKIDSLLETQFAAGRLYAAITSRPGQSGRADGYILEGKELEVSCLPSVSRSQRIHSVAKFYLRKIRTGKQKHAHV